MEFEACYCTITVPFRHVVPIGLIRAMCGLFGAPESRVAQSLFVNIRGAKFASWGIPRSKFGVEAFYCKITVPFRHVVFIRLIRAMCGQFRATEFRVAQSLVCEY